MKRAPFLIFLLLWAEFILGSTKGESKVLVVGPLIRLIRPTELRKTCGTTAQIEACTSFAGQLLHGRCEGSSERWSLIVDAQFIPVMHVIGTTHVEHERNHIGDIEESVASHLDGLERLEFASEDQCEAARLEAIAQFPHLMDEFKRQSNEKRHPKKKRLHARGVQPSMETLVPVTASLRASARQRAAARGRSRRR